MGLIQFTSNVTDHSNANGYQFEFHCDKRGNGYMSSFQANKVGMAGGFLRAASSLFGGSGALDGIAGAGDYLRDATRGQARDAAFARAVEEAKPRFRQCSRCGKWVCPEQCWNEKRGLCEACAPDLEEEAAAAQAQIAVEQVWTKARETDQTGGIDVSSKVERSATCPALRRQGPGQQVLPRVRQAAPRQNQLPPVQRQDRSHHQVLPGMRDEGLNGPARSTGAPIAISASG